MRCIVQRSGPAQVEIGGRISGAIESGLVVLVAFGSSDTGKELEWMAHKLTHLRIFNDEQGKMILSLQDVGGGILLISQFTLYGDCRKGMRPSFTASAPPDIARELYDSFADLLKGKWPGVAQGEFGANMNVSLTNQGPVTLVIDRESHQ